MTTRSRFILSGLLVGMMIAANGCALGATALRVSYPRYNEAIQLTTGEQLLLNLVRLRYRDAPLFLQVGSISAQFTLVHTAEAVGTLNENVGMGRANNPDVLRLGGQVQFSERPTLTIVPLQGDEFTQKMLMPLSADNIALLNLSGWRLDRVLRLTLHRMNALDNATNASSPTPALAPPFADFQRVARALHEAHRLGLISFGYEEQEIDLSDPIPIEAVTGETLVSAARDGLVFRVTDDGRRSVLRGRARTLLLRVAAGAAGNPELQILFDRLQLQPNQSAYPIVVALPDYEDNAGPIRKEIAVSPRSLLGTMFYLSHAVEAPRAHRSQGLVTATIDAQGQEFDWAEVTGDLLRVRSQRMQPMSAAVAVNYRGYWFYIDDTDLDSKSTFALLLQMFALQAGVGEAVSPLLTLPVGG